MVTWDDYVKLRDQIRDAGLELPHWISESHWAARGQVERKMILQRIAEDTGLISDKPATGSESAW